MLFETLILSRRVESANQCVSCAPGAGKSVNSCLQISNALESLVLGQVFGCASLCSVIRFAVDGLHDILKVVHAVVEGSSWVVRVELIDNEGTILKPVVDVITSELKCTNRVLDQVVRAGLNQWRGGIIPIRPGSNLVRRSDKFITSFRSASGSAGVGHIEGGDDIAAKAGGYIYVAKCIVCKGFGQCKKGVCVDLLGTGLKFLTSQLCS